MRKAIIFSIIFLFPLKAHCFWFGGPKLKAEIANKKNYKFQLVDKLKKMQQELGVIKNNQLSIESRIMTRLDTNLNAMSDINAKITGIDRSFQNTLKSGRDAISNVNETPLMKYIILSIVGLVVIFVGGFIGVLILLVKFFTKRKENQHVVREAEYFKQETEKLKSKLNI